MTKAQKENQARFKKVQAEAKKLKAKNPRLAHAQAVKQAWAIVSPKSGKKVGAVKKKTAAKKQTGKTNKAVDKKIQAKPVGKRLSKSGKVYYEARANRSDKGRLLGVKKKPAVSKHKDTNSHNVNIKVISGVKLDFTKKLLDTIKEIEQRQNVINSVILRKQELINRNGKEWYTNWIKTSKAYVSELKKHKTELKKLI